MSIPPKGLAPRPEPDWSGAAEVLIEGCAHLPTAEERVRWLERLCLSLGDTLYPAILRVLCLIGEHGDTAAQASVADTLVLALQTGRIPSGRHAAWGTTLTSSTGPTRTMGPIEYLCAWYAQPDGRGTLSAVAFDRAARSLLCLVSHSAQARRLYCAKLLNDAEDPMGGAWTRSSRQALRAMSQAWAAPETNPQRAAALAVDAFLLELKKSDSQRPFIASTSWAPPPPLR